MGRKPSAKKEIPVENMNTICVDCQNECKQEASVAIMNCPSKVKIDEQLELFTRAGQPRKIRAKDGEKKPGASRGRPPKKR